MITQETIDSWMRGYTREQLSEAFNKVANPANWKYPIDAVIPKADLDVTETAVTFFAGCSVEVVEDRGDEVRIQAIGYYLAIGP